MKGIMYGVRVTVMVMLACGCGVGNQTPVLLPIGEALKFDLSGVKSVAAKGASADSKSTRRSIGDGGNLLGILVDGTTRAIVTSAFQVDSLPDVAYLSTGADGSLFVCFASSLAVPTDQEQVNWFSVQFIRVTPENNIQVIWPPDEDTRSVIALPQFGSAVRPNAIGDLFFMVSDGSCYRYVPSSGMLDKLFEDSQLSLVRDFAVNEAGQVLYAGYHDRSYDGLFLGLYSGGEPVFIDEPPGDADPQAVQFFGIKDYFVITYPSDPGYSRRGVLKLTISPTGEVLIYDKIGNSAGGMSRLIYDPQNRFAQRGSAIIERSPDGGTQWSAQVLDNGALSYAKLESVVESYFQSGFKSKEETESYLSDPASFPAIVAQIESNQAAFLTTYFEGALLPVREAYGWGIFLGGITDLFSGPGGVYAVVNRYFEIPFAIIKLFDENGRNDFQTVNFDDRSVYASNSYDGIRILKPGQHPVQSGGYLYIAYSDFFYPGYQGAHPFGRVSLLDGATEYFSDWTMTDVKVTSFAPGSGVCYLIGEKTSDGSSVYGRVDLATRNVSLYDSLDDLRMIVTLDGS